MRAKKTERIGVFGGTFNPPHMGHLVIAERARAAASLDRVLFVPAALPPHKLGRSIVSPQHRLAMVRLAISGNRFFQVSDIEVRKGGISYTVDTLRLLAQTMPHAELYLILGGDSVAEYQSWKEPSEIRGLATLLMYPRETMDRMPVAGVELLTGPLIGISSTEIRGKVARGESIRYLVPDSVARYIRSRRLYVNQA